MGDNRGVKSLLGGLDGGDVAGGLCPCWCSTKVATEGAITHGPFLDGKIGSSSSRKCQIQIDMSETAERTSCIENLTSNT